jgi:hypothetical protein
MRSHVRTTVMKALGAEALNLVDAKKTPRNPRSIIFQFFCLWPQAAIGPTSDVESVGGAFGKAAG